jgi:predicted ATPase
MIRVDRNTVPSPLSPNLVERAKLTLSEWYQQPLEIRNKKRRELRDTLILDRQAKGALVELFRNKCAYCESDIGVTAVAEIDRFRPFADASNLSGEGSADHYAWLAADWENLYLACPSCARSKRSLFPVEGKRAEPLTPIQLVRGTEQALLIDPCFEDPENHLEFVGTGYVQARSHKGEVTIKVFNLNREGLVRARRNVWQLVGVHVLAEARDEDLQKLLSPSAMYVAVAHAALQSALAQQGPRPIRDNVVSRMPTERRSAEEILAADEEAFRLAARPIRRVEIKNFRALRDIVINFGEPGSERAPWLMLLGENATGKTTVLQAIALALAGADEARRHVRPRKLLSTGAFTGSIVVWFWDQDAAVELRFSRDSDRFAGTRGPSAIVLGYGAVRYAERKPRGNDFSPRFSRIAPILERVARIRYPGRWLLNLDDKRFDTAARALQSVLPVSNDSVMFRDASSIFFNVGGHRASLADLSAGYQTIVGMCADIMRLLFERWDTLSSATAIVLIDELDAHLHPRWTMRIVNALREAFPQAQFIASTHNPLALRGLRNGEVTLLRRDENGDVFADQNLPPIEGMQVDQLLTSRAFGLDSTLDPEIEALLDEYYHLRSLPVTPAHADRIAEIRLRIGDREVFGRNMRERLMLAAAGQFIEDAESDLSLTRPLDQQEIRRLREIAGLGSVPSDKSDQ